MSYPLMGVRHERDRFLMNFGAYHHRETGDTSLGDAQITLV